MNVSETMLVTLLRCALLGQVPQPAGDVDWREVYDIAYKSRVLFAASEAILRMPPAHRPDETIIGHFHAGSDLELYSQTMQSRAFPAAFEALSRTGARFCPVAGVVLREYYPAPAMRAMNDGDVFIHPRDRHKAKEAMLRAGYAFAGGDGARMTFEKPPIITLRLNLDPLSDYGDNSLALYGLWDVLAPAGACRREMPPCLHYVYLLLRLDKHVRESGLSPRDIMDFWVMRKKHGDFLQNEDVCDYLRDYGLYALAKAVRHIEGAWFDSQRLPEYLSDAESWAVRGLFDDARRDVSFLRDGERDNGANAEKGALEKRKNANRLALFYNRRAAAKKRVSALARI